MNKRNIMIIVGILSFIVIIGGISYSYFVYNKDVGNVSLNAGEITLNLSDISGNLALTGAIPKSDNDGKISSDYIDFTVDATVDTEKIYYEIYLLPKQGNTLDTSYLKTYLTDQNDVMIKGVTLYNSLPSGEIENGKVICKGLIELNNDYSSKTETKDFRLRLWLDEGYNEPTSKTFEFDIYVYAKNVEEGFSIDGAGAVKSAINAKINAGTNSCNPIYTEDGIIYFSGTNECVDMNYVWYSGKLWRITAIYPDGAMKLVTEKLITTLEFDLDNGSVFYTDENHKSLAYQWLNENFYSTLYNPTNFIDTSKQWNATKTANESTKPSNTTMVTANVGLLSTYEMYISRRNLDSNTTGYISNEYWVHEINQNSYGNPSGIHPSIFIKPGLEFTGSGTITLPYRIVGDKDIGNTNELINTRLSGEYVKLKNGNNEQVFRIVAVNDSKTRIVAVDYADNGATRPLSVDVDGYYDPYAWGDITMQNPDTWYTYLNNTYYPNLTSTYGNIFDTGTYYLGTTPDFDYHLTTTVTENYNIGLLSYGEMFATSQADSYSEAIPIWLMNKISDGDYWQVREEGFSYEYDEAPVQSNTYTVNPVVYLKSTVKIISGDGTKLNPYVVGL